MVILNPRYHFNLFEVNMRSLVIVFLGLSVISCKARKKSELRNSDTGIGCDYSKLGFEENSLLSAASLTVDRFMKRESNMSQTVAALDGEVMRLAGGDREKELMLRVSASNYSQMRIAERIMKTVNKAVFGVNIDQSDIDFISGLEVTNPSRYIDMIAYKYRNEYSCVKKVGFKVNSLGDWDLTDAKISVEEIRKSPCLRTAMGVFFGSGIASESSLESGEALNIGNSVVSVCSGYAVKSSKVWKEDVDRNLDGFKGALAEYMSQSGAGASYSEWMRGRYRDYKGERPHVIAKDGAYNSMLKLRQMLRCLGIHREMNASLGGIMQAALKIDNQNIESGIQTLNAAEKAAIAAPFIPLVIYSVPLVGGSLIGSISIAALGKASATMPLILFAFGGGMAVVSGTIDANHYGGGWMCRVADAIAGAGAQSMIIAPYMAAIPLAPVLSGSGAAAISGSAALGTKVYGVSNILVALGFVGSMGYDGVKEIQQCRKILDMARMMSVDSSGTDLEIRKINDLLVEAQKMCLSGGINIAFAVSGGVSLAANRAKGGASEAAKTSEVPTSTTKESSSAEASNVGKKAEISNAPLEAFLKETNGFDRTNEFSKLPTGLPSDFVGPLETLRSLMRNNKQVFELVQQLEADVIQRAQERKIENFSALEEVLAEYEQKGGFKPAIDLEARAYTANQFMSMLAEGATFRDTVFTNTNRVGGSAHGRDTHRIQLNVMMRHMNLNPELYNGKTPVEMFKILGDVKLYEKLNWDDTGRSGNSTWSPFFDSFESNFSCPEWLRNKHDYWPGLGDWANLQRANTPSLPLV
jgi:hypothetical protein